MPLMRIGRRAVLRGFGGIVVGLPFLESLAEPRAARAQTTAPRRCVFWHWPNGVVIDRWAPVAAADGTITRLSPILRPLDRHLRHLLPIGGLRLGSALVPENTAVSHARGAGALFTNSRLAGEGDAGITGFPVGAALGASVDAELARRLAPGTRHRLLRVQVGRTAPSPMMTLFHDAPGVPAVPNPNRWEVRRLLFGDATTDARTLAQLTARRRTVLDAVLAEYREARCRVGAADRPRLDRHLEAIREVERGLDGALAAREACRAPMLDADPGASFLRDNDAFPELGRLQMDLLAVALACDATRIAAIQWSAPTAPLVHRWLGHKEEHHTLSHRATDEADARLVEIQSWYAGQLAVFLDRLAAVTEEDGATLLEHTALVASTEVSTGWNHAVTDCAFLLAGGAGGAWRGGRYLRFPDVDHGRLLLTVLRALGVQATSVGDPRTCDGGVLPGVLA